MPDAWKVATPTQLCEVAEAFSSDHDYSSWRALLLALTQPWSWPSQQQLLDTLAKFHDLDQLATGCVTREQYDFVELWFSTDTALVTPLEKSAPKSINRAAEIKRIFFDIFASQDDTLNYVNMLLHFCMSTSPYVGLLKALSVASGVHIPHCLIHGHEIESAVDPLAEEVPLDGLDGANNMIPLPALYKVLSFGRNIAQTAPDVVFSEVDDEVPIADDTEVTKEKLSLPMLAAIYDTLDAEEGEPLPLSSLLRHSALVELLLAARQFKLVDVRHFISENIDFRSSRPPTER